VLSQILSYFLNSSSRFCSLPLSLSLISSLEVFLELSLSLALTYTHALSSSSSLSLSLSLSLFPLSLLRSISCSLANFLGVLSQSQTKTETMEVRSQDAVILLRLRVENGKVVVKFHGTPLEGGVYC
jgi:hypothetical protein